VSTPSQDDATAALNQVLNEVIDMMLETKQANWKVARSHELHEELDFLLNDLVKWRTLIGDRDEALGVNPLSFMSSAAGRNPLNLWPATPTDEEVRAVIDDHLGRLDEHLAVAKAEQFDDASRSALAEVQRGLAGHRKALQRKRLTE
jgi:DNA-binding ferritin-like protein